MMEKISSLAILEGRGHIALYNPRSDISELRFRLEDWRDFSDEENLV
jgi:hypothetical protein